MHWQTTVQLLTARLAFRFDMACDACVNQARFTSLESKLCTTAAHSLQDSSVTMCKACAVQEYIGIDILLQKQRLELQANDCRGLCIKIKTCTHRIDGTRQGANDIPDRNSK